MRTVFGIGILLVISLACGGMGGSGNAVVEALKQDDFPKAEALVDELLAASPDAALANRLLGDLSIRRAQKFSRTWEKNISKAIDSYRRAVEAEPGNCENWNRLALVVAAGAQRPQVRFDPALVKALPLTEGVAACAGASVLYLQDYQQPTEEEAAAIRTTLGEKASNEAVRADRFPSLMVAYQGVGLGGLSWETVVRPPKAQVGRWFVVTESPQLAKGVSGARDRSVDERTKFEVLQARRPSITFMDFGFGATLSAKAFVPASSCPGVVSWRISSDSGKPIGYCTKGPVKAKTHFYRADLLRPADDSHWQEQSIRAAAMNPASARDAQCVGGLVNLMMEHEASCAVSYKQAVSRQRTFDETQGRIALDIGHADRILAARNGEVFYGAEVATELAAGKVAKGLPFGTFLLTRGEIAGCQGEPLLTGATFSDDYSSMVVRCSADGFEFDFEDMAVTGWRRAR